MDLSNPWIVSCAIHGSMLSQNLKCASGCGYELDFHIALYPMQLAVHYYNVERQFCAEKHVVTLSHSTYYILIQLIQIEDIYSISTDCAHAHSNWAISLGNTRPGLGTGMY